MSHEDGRIRQGDLSCCGVAERSELAVVGRYRLVDLQDFDLRHLLERAAILGELHKAALRGADGLLELVQYRHVGHLRQWVEDARMLLHILQRAHLERRLRALCSHRVEPRLQHLGGRLRLGRAVHQCRRFLRLALECCLEPRLVFSKPLRLLLELEPLLLLLERLLARDAESAVLATVLCHELLRLGRQRSVVGGGVLGDLLLRFEPLAQLLRVLERLLQLEGGLRAPERQRLGALVAQLLGCLLILQLLGRLEEVGVGGRRLLCQLVDLCLQRVSLLNQPLAHTLLARKIAPQLLELVAQSLDLGISLLHLGLVLVELQVLLTQLRAEREELSLAHALHLTVACRLVQLVSVILDALLQFRQLRRQLGHPVDQLGPLPLERVHLLL